MLTNLFLVRQNLGFSSTVINDTHYCINCYYHCACDTSSNTDVSSAIEALYQGKLRQTCVQRARLREDHRIDGKACKASKKKGKSGTALPPLAKQQAAEQAPPMEEVEIGREDTQSLNMEVDPSHPWLAQPRPPLEIISAMICEWLPATGQRVFETSGTESASLEEAVNTINIFPNPPGKSQSRPSGAGHFLHKLAVASSSLSPTGYPINTRVGSRISRIRR